MEGKNTLLNSDKKNSDDEVMGHFTSSRLRDETKPARHSYLYRRHLKKAGGINIPGYRHGNGLSRISGSGE
ncbi:MAG TPA: hypothetical protein VKZ56_05180 [Membranihabitans sp.]|nr:hypothetical protein [Membranihabitans sp.]